LARLTARVLTAMKMQRRKLTTPLGPEVVAPLRAACGDDDSTIAQQARLAVGELASPETQVALADTLCAQWQVACWSVPSARMAPQPVLFMHGTMARGVGWSRRAGTGQRDVRVGLARDMSD